MDDRTLTIDSALETHWRLFGSYPGASLHEEHGLLWFESAIASLPYNGIIGTRMSSPIALDAIAHAMVDHFERRHVPFFWLGRPSDVAPGFAEAMQHAGLGFIETLAGMDLDIGDWSAPETDPDIEIREVDRDGVLTDGLRDYEGLNSGYWGIADDPRPLARAVTRHFLGERNPGFRLVAYVERHAVGKVYVQLAGMPEWVMVAGLGVIPAARGAGVAQALVNAAIARVQEAGAERVVLHATELARPTFERVGFTVRCDFPLHATSEMFH